MRKRIYSLADGMIEKVKENVKDRIYILSWIDLKKFVERKKEGKRWAFYACHASRLS